MQLVKESYINIAQTIGTDSSGEIAFITDNVEEAVAAKAAGWNAILATREGNPPISAASKKEFSVISTFEGLFWLLSVRFQIFDM